MDELGKGGGQPDVRPWGFFVVLDEGPAHKLKRIHVSSGKRLSYQTHARRSEHWFVVKGAGVVTLDDEKIRLSAGHVVDIPQGAAHRIENVGDEELVFIEVQTGESFGEDDITRLEDDFGRVGLTD